MTSERPPQTIREQIEQLPRFSEPGMYTGGPHRVYVLLADVLACLSVSQPRVEAEILDLIAELQDEVAEFATKDDPYYNGVRRCIDGLKAIELPCLSVREEGWQPIETAPKDGREVLLTVQHRAGIPYGALVGHYMAGGHCIQDHPPIDSGWYFWNGCMFDEASQPTHWIPLPSPPVRGGGENR